MDDWMDMAEEKAVGRADKDAYGMTEDMTVSSPAVYGYTRDCIRYGIRLMREEMEKLYEQGRKGNIQRNHQRPEG